MPYITSYNPLPIAFTHGKGVWLYDSENKAYLDSFSGIGVCGLGHAHPDVTDTIQKQSARLIHTSNAFHVLEQEKLAEKLIQLTGMQQVFFANSGAEANEAAIKLTRLFGHAKGIETPSIIVMSGAFHGRTMATLTATGSRKVQAGFEPLVPGFVRAPYNDIGALQTIAHNRNDIVAVMLEPIQGESGVQVADAAYLCALAALCDKHDWMLIMDEVQTGNGRTGHYFACQEFAIVPDVITTAKGLGNGIPIGACIMHNRACDLFKPGNHGSTFGGNPLACAVGNMVIDVILREKLCEKVAKAGVLLRDNLMQQLAPYSCIKSIRGKGFMIGIELDRAAADIKAIGLKHGILLNVTADNVIRLLPPLVINSEEMQMLIERLCLSIADLNGQD